MDSPLLQVNGTIFSSIIRHPVGIRPSLAGTSQSIENRERHEPTRTTGSELLPEFAPAT